MMQKKLDLVFRHQAGTSRQGRDWDGAKSGVTLDINPSDSDVCVAERPQQERVVSECLQVMYR